MGKIREKPLRDEEFWLGKSIKNDGLDVGLYEEARKTGKTVSMLLEDMKSDALGETSPYYGKTKREVLAKKESMRIAGQSPPKTAFEECLEKACILTKGAYSDPVSKFFEIADVDVLFPEYTSDRVHASLIAASLVGDFCFAETVIDSSSYQKIYLEDDADDRQLKNVAKYQDLPETRIEVGEQTVRLDMYGRYIMTAKTDIKRQRINVLARFLDQIGLQMGIDQTDLMFYRLINGDGNTGTTPQTTVTAAASGAGELSLNDAINWAIGLPTPYQCDKFVFRKANRVKWYGRLYDATTTSIGNDKMNVFPDVYEWDRSVITANYGWGVDSRYAIEMISSGGVQTKAEELVRKVSEGLAFWCEYEFAIGDAYAVQKFDLAS